MFGVPATKTRTEILKCVNVSDYGILQCIADPEYYDDLICIQKKNHIWEMQRLQKRSSPQVPELPALAEEQFSTAKAMYNLTDELDALARLENKKQDTDTPVAKAHGKKRWRDLDDFFEDDEEIPSKIARMVEESWLSLNGKCDDDPSEHNWEETTPKRSPIDSSYESCGKSPYVSQPSVGNSSGIEASPQSYGIWTPSAKQSGYSLDESALVSHADLTDFCRKNYKVLKKELDPKHNVADRMYERRIITKTTLESLSEEPCRRTRVDILVKGLVHDSRASVPDIYNKVLAIFHEESLDYLIQCTNTKDKSGFEENRYNVSGRFGYLASIFYFAPNSDRPDGFFITAKAVLRRDKAFSFGDLKWMTNGLEEELEPRDVIDTLLVSGFLTFSDHEDIFRATSRLERVRLLLDIVRRCGDIQFHLFIGALSKKCLKLIRKLKKEYQRQKQATTPSLKPTENSDDLGKCQFLSSAAEMMELKVCFGPASVKDIEQSIVDYNNSQMENSSLEEEVMGLAGLSIEGMEFSSVRIKLSACSDESLSRLRKVLLADPAAIKHMLVNMMTKGHLHQLKQREVRTVTIELHVPKDKTIARKCRCKLTKEIIVGSFSYLEKKLMDVPTIIDTIIESKLLDDEGLADILDIKQNREPATQKLLFLQRLLTLPEYIICLFEQSLRRTNQDALVQKILEMQRQNKDSKKIESIGPKDIRRNRNYLIEELEPKMFVSVFETADAKLDEITSNDPRKQRCKYFIKTMLNVGQTAIDRFVRELEKHGMEAIKEILCRRNVDSEQMRRNILKHYTKLVDEIEPTKLRDKLVQEGVFKSKEWADMYKTATRRRERAVVLVRNLFRKDDKALPVFADALLIGQYDEIAKDITNSEDHATECPYLKSMIEGTVGMKTHGKDMTFSAQFDITWNEEACGIPDARDDGHVDRTQFTETWVATCDSKSDTSFDTETAAQYMRAEPATTMGSSCLSDCIRIHKQGLITHHVTNKTLNRIRSSPVGSIGTSSSSTDYEDISPCPSPCSHYETHMPAFPYMTQAISFETSIQKANQNICSNHACAMYHDEISISASQQHDEHTQLEDKNRVIYRKRSVTEHFTDYNNWITLIFKKIGKNDKSNCLPCQELCMSLHCKSKSTRNSVSSNNKTDS